MEIRVKSNTIIKLKALTKIALQDLEKLLEKAKDDCSTVSSPEGSYQVDAYTPPPESY